MIDALIGAAMLGELTRAEIDLNQVADVHFTQSVQESELKRVSYDVATKGRTKGSLEEFRQVTKDILDDKRGWRRVGVEFVQVEKGGDLHLVLATPDEIEKAAPGACSPILSCTVAPIVYINDERWMGSSDKYKALNVSVAHYREMVLNHEVGHFLGHGHEFSCDLTKQRAGVMIRRAEDLGSCAPTYWPLPNELWTKGL